MQLADERRELINAYRRLLRSQRTPGSEDDDTIVNAVNAQFTKFYKRVINTIDDTNRKQVNFWNKLYKTDVERLRKVKTKFNVPINIPVGDLIVFKKLEIETEDIDLSTSSIFGDLDIITMEPAEVIKLVSAIIKPFGGEWTELNSFVQNIKLVETVIPDAQSNIAVAFIKGKLTGAAAAYVPQQSNTYDEIIRALQQNIKADSATVIEARLAAVRFDNKNLTTFATEVEKLAEQLVNAFISEGIPVRKSNELAISRVTETCRKSARNDLVKSVLASSTFTTPKEVLSKFATEVADQNKDKQFLAFNSQFTRGNNSRYRGRGYSQGPSYYQQRGGFNQSRGEYQPRGGQGYGYNYAPRPRGGFTHNRGRGGYNNSSLPIRAFEAAENFSYNSPEQINNEGNE